jgi:predicted phosphate transport protein (TIGR00153 family)
MAGIPVSTSQAVVGDVEAASEKARLVIEIESRADALEEQIREVLLQGAFLPHMRSDVYRLVEAVDAIAGEGESIARFVFDQSPLIPEQFESRLLDLYRLSSRKASSRTCTATWTASAKSKPR